MRPNAHEEASTRNRTLRQLVVASAIAVGAGPLSAAQVFLDCDLPATAAVTLHANVALDEAAKTASFTVKESAGIWTDKPALFLPNEIKVALGYDGVQRRAIIINRETLALTWQAVKDGKEPQELHGQCRLAEQRQRRI